MMPPAMEDQQVDVTLPSQNKLISPVCILFKDARNVFKMDELGKEIANIAVPAAMAFAADPLASLIDTAFIGHIGPVELAAVGVSIAVFNQVSRVAIFPLVSVTTSFVAEENAISDTSSESVHENGNLEAGSNIRSELISDSVENSSKSRPNGGGCFSLAKHGNRKRNIPSASSALFFGLVLGLLQAAFLISLAKPVLKFMGVHTHSPMMHPAQEYLKIRSLGAPAVLLSLAMQGVFRGFKDTKTPLYATLAGDTTNIVLDPIFIFVLGLGVKGAAIAHVISQYLISVILFFSLMRQVHLLPPSIQHVQYRRFLKNGFLLLLRVIAVTFCVTLAASLAARRGPTSMAAFQVCLQAWMATSLLADGLAVAGQALLASAFAKEDYGQVRAITSRVLQLGFVLGVVLAIILGVGLKFGDTLFTKDVSVLHLIAIGIPFVAATQPISVLAFVLDGVNFGASDFAFSGISMVIVGIVSILILLVLSHSHGFIGIWVALTIYMVLRAFASFLRIGTGRGPWIFLRT